MQTECSADLFGFARVAGRSVVAAFDGGKITSDAGGLLLGAADQAVGLIDRFARCFRDSRSEELIEHTVATMIGQRIFGIALGYEDVVDHDELRHDCWPPNCAGRISMPVPGRWRKWPVSSPRSAPAGPRCGSCCAPIPALPARG